MLKTVLFRRNHFIHVLNVVGRVRITNTSNSMEINNHEVKLVFNPSTLGSCGSNGTNFGFHTEESQTLPIWIEKWTSDQAIVWTQVPHIGIGQSKEYIITCDPEHKSENNPDKVFTFYDDFNDPNLSKWGKHYGNGSISVSGGVVRIQSSGDLWTEILSVKNLVADGTTALIAEGWLNVIARATAFGLISQGGGRCHFGHWISLFAYYSDGTTGSHTQIGSCPKGSWHLNKVTWKEGEFVNFYTDWGVNRTFTNYIMTRGDGVKLWIGAWNIYNGTIKAGWVRVRKYIDSEPQINFL